MPALEKPASPSPFSTHIPNLQTAWDSTTLSLLQECARKYQYSMLYQFHARGTSIHLDFGGQFARVLELYRKDLARGLPFEEAVQAGVAFCLAWDDSVHAEDTRNFPYKNRHTLSRTFVWHTEQYRHDSFQVLTMDNGEAAAELSFRMQLDVEAPGGEPFLLCGHLDALGYFEDNLYFKDDKTTKSALTDSYFAGFNPNTQMTNYFVATQVILDRPAAGGIVDAVQLLVNGARFARRFVHRTQGQIEEWRKNLHFWLRQAQRFAEEEYWPMNTNACNNYGGCPFRSICALDPSVRENFLKGEFEKWEWNPLEIRGDV